jgi:CheY-like chemotaxis protein
MQLHSIRILVVDDHQPMREILKSLLFGLGARKVEEARDAAQAFESLKFGSFDLMMTDYDMAGGTGIDLTRMIRRAATNPNRKIPIIMITGRAEGPVILGARDAGVDEYLIKPLTTASLCQKLEAALTKRRPFVETAAYVGPDRRRKTVAFHGPDKRRKISAAAAG